MELRVRFGFHWVIREEMGVRVKVSASINSFVSQSVSEIDVRGPRYVSSTPHAVLSFSLSGSYKIHLGHDVDPRDLQVHHGGHGRQDSAEEKSGLV